MDQPEVQPEKFDRPHLTQEEQKEMLAVATKINGIFDRKRRAAFIFSICLENKALLKEVTAHRQARGFNELKVHNIDVSQIG
jgi:hypothetical protein